MYYWLLWVSVAARGLSLVAASGGRARALGTWASAVMMLGLSSCGTWALDCRLSSCGARAQPLRGTWDPPGPGLEPVSSALAGGLSTTAPPGKPTRNDWAWRKVIEVWVLIGDRFCRCLRLWILFWMKWKLVILIYNLRDSLGLLCQE